MSWTIGGYIHALRSEVSNILLIIIIVIAVVVVIGFLIWAAVALKAIETQQKILKNFDMKEFDKHFKPRDNE